MFSLFPESFSATNMLLAYVLKEFSTEGDPVVDLPEEYLKPGGFREKPGEGFFKEYFYGRLYRKQKIGLQFLTELHAIDLQTLKVTFPRLGGKQPRWFFSSSVLQAKKIPNGFKTVCVRGKLYGQTVSKLFPGKLNFLELPPFIQDSNFNAFPSTLYSRSY